jgi:uncharacterized protein (TIGR04255 family)
MCSALDDSLQGAHVWRFGLRYLDEIRLPGLVARAGDWSGWLAPHLTASSTAAGEAPVVGFHGDVAWMTGGDRAVTMRWGTFDQPTVLADTLPLIRDGHASSGPIFVLDIDSYWQPSAPPVYSSGSAIEVFDQLHNPTGQAFQSALTEQLRAEFRKERTS